MRRGGRGREEEYVNLYFYLSSLTILILSCIFCQVKSTHGEFVVRELSAVAGAITITCLMVCILCLIKAYTNHNYFYIPVDAGIDF